jgi:hypothetical protein
MTSPCPYCKGEVLLIRPSPQQPAKEHQNSFCLRQKLDDGDPFGPSIFWRVAGFIQYVAGVLFASTLIISVISLPIILLNGIPAVLGFCLIVFILGLKRRGFLPLAVLFSREKQKLITNVTKEYLILEATGLDSWRISQELRHKFNATGPSSYVIDMKQVVQEMENPSKQQQAAAEIAKVVSLVLFQKRTREFSVTENIWPKARILQDNLSMTYGLCLDCYQTLRKHAYGPN